MVIVPAFVAVLLGVLIAGFGYCYGNNFAVAEHPWRTGIGCLAYALGGIVAFLGCALFAASLFL